jgi:hypothetical protein
MDIDQLHAMSLKISDLQVALDVFEGMFIGQKNADQIVIPFPEIGKAISAALITELIIGCAAIFSDPPRSMGSENMSFENLRLKYLSVESSGTKLIYEQLTAILKAMNIKDFRNKHVGHLDLNNALGITSVNRHISVNQLREVFTLAQKYLHSLGRESGLLPKTAYMAYYSAIPDSRNTEVFLSKINGNA